MNDRTNRTVICSIAFIDIVDYSKRVGQDQLVLKEHFNSLIGEVVKDIAQNDRVLIDTGDGAALCFMGDPEDALFVSMNLRDRLRTGESEAIGLSVRFGINLGPVRMIQDINGHQNVIGDGINVAQRVMSFAEPNQIMVSRSYYEVVSRLSREYTQLFHYAGARTDKHVREHEVYEVGPGMDDAAPVPPEQPLPASIAGIAGAPPAAAMTGANASAAALPVPARNKWLVPGAVAAVVALAIAIFAGTYFKSEKAGEAVRSEAPAVPATNPPVAQPVAPVPAVTPAPAAPAPAVAATPAAKPDADAKVEAAKEKMQQQDPSKALPPVAAEKKLKKETPLAQNIGARKDAVAKADNNVNGTLEFWINPWGDVFIDGKQVGTAPPLKVYNLPQGSHRVEIYNDSAGFPYKTTVEVKANQVLRINQTFR